jgi:hypothetical protein
MKFSRVLSINQRTFADIDEEEELHRVPFAWAQARRDDTHIPGGLAVRSRGKRLRSYAKRRLTEIRTLSLRPVHLG